MHESWWEARLFLHWGNGIFRGYLSPARWRLGQRHVPACRMPTPRPWFWSSQREQGTQASGHGSADGSVLCRVAVELYPARVLTFSPGALQAWLWPPLVLFVQAPLTLAHFLTWFFSLSSDSVNSLQFSCSVLSNSLWPPGLQHTRLPCPSPTPRAYSNSCPSRRWCHATISSSVVPFSSRLQSFPASGSFPMSQFFTSGGQSIGVSASASVLPMNIQDLFPLRLTGWISLQSKGLSGVFSNTTVQKHQFFGTQLSLNYLSVNSFSVELFIDHHQPEVVSVAYT